MPRNSKANLVPVPVEPPDPRGPQRLHTLEQIADAWGVSRAYVYGFVVRKELRAIVLPSENGKRRGRILIDPKDLTAFLESKKTEAA